MIGILREKSKWRGRFVSGRFRVVRTVFLFGGRLCAIVFVSVVICRQNSYLSIANGNHADNRTYPNLVVRICCDRMGCDLPSKFLS